MTTIPDTLGRAWPLAKLDELLRDPSVRRTVTAAERAAYGPSGVPAGFSAKRLQAWGRAQGRTQPGMALLSLLMLRSG